MIKNIVYIELQAVKGNSNVIVNGPVVINNYVANESENAMKLMPDETNQQETVRSKQLLYFDQVSKKNSKSGNKGKIDAISPKALPVVFETSELLRQITECEDNPFNKGHIVDVVVQTVNSMPKVYKVIAYYESFPIDEDEK
jgi:hypothetical protein